MKLTDFLTSEQIILDMKATTKEEALEELVRPLVPPAKLKKSQEAVKTLLERETLSSTGIGQGVAIPHARVDGIEDITMVLGLCAPGINFNAQDGKKTHIFFLILAPPSSSSLYLQVLARVSRLLKNDSFCQSLKQPHLKVSEVWRLLEEKEKQEVPLR